MQINKQESIWRWYKALGLIGLLLCVASCTQKLEEEPYFSKSECRRVDLINNVTGASVIGAEDMAIDEGRNRLIVSAYDRRQVEKAAARKASSIPQGGLYAVSITDLLSREERRVAAKPLVEPQSITGGLRPHGIDFDPFTDEIVFINRAYVRSSAKSRSWDRVSRIERLGADGAVFMGAGKETHCAANDLVSGNGDILLSHDHGSCGWFAAFEDVFALKRSGIQDDKESNDGRDGSVTGRVRFANGLTNLSTTTYALAATREAQIIVYEKAAPPIDQPSNRDDFQLTEKTRIALPGGPDNLTVNSEGMLIAAVHPSLLRMGAHRKLGIGKAPSRILQVSGVNTLAADPDSSSETTRLLFDDLRGNLWSGATVAIAEDNWLVAGSATDQGLLLCQKNGDEV